MHRLTRQWIQDQPSVSIFSVEIKHAVQGSGDRVCRPIADSVQVPIVFNEARDGSLIGHAMIDIVGAREGRNDQSE